MTTHSYRPSNFYEAVILSSFKNLSLLLGVFHIWELVYKSKYWKFQVNKKYFESIDQVENLNA